VVLHDEALFFFSRQFLKNRFVIYYNYNLQFYIVRASLCDFQIVSISLSF